MVTFIPNILNKKLWVVIIVLSIVVIVALMESNKTNDAITIGAILPLTGDEATIGNSIKEGINLAVKEIESQKKLDRSVKIVYEDSKSDPKIGISAYNKLTKVDGIKVIFSSVSGVSLAIAPIAEKDKVDILIIGSAAPKISEAGDYVFRHNLQPKDEAHALSGYILDHDFNDIAVLVVNAESGKSYLEYFKKYFEMSGGHIQIIEQYEKGNVDFRLAMTKIKELKPKAILAIGYNIELGRMMKQAKELGFNAQWFSIYAAEDQQTVDAGGGAADGLIYTSFYDFEGTSTSFQEFKTGYGVTYNKKPGPYAGLAFDFMNILAEVIKGCSNVVEPDCIKSGLYQTKKYVGATGNISFDENGDTKKSIIFKTIKDGNFIRL